MKFCPSCQQTLPVESFSKSSRAKSGLQTYCKACHLKKQQADAGAEERRKRYVANKPGENIWRHLRLRASRINVPCMDRESFVGWYSSVEKRCAYCGLYQESAVEYFGHKLHIDRKNGDAGYTDGNICLACHRCNVVKSKYLTHEQMKQVAAMFFNGQSNAHDDLVKALTKIAEGEVMSHDSPFTHLDTVLAYQELARAALAKAGA